MSTGVRKKRVSHNTISFWLRSVISFAYSSVSKEDCCYLRVRAREVRKVVTSLFFRRNCAVHQVLKARIWSAQSTFSSFYLGDITHSHLWWWLSRSCNPLSLFDSRVVNLLISLSRRLYLRLPCPYILLVVMCLHLLLLLWL